MYFSPANVGYMQGNFLTRKRVILFSINHSGLSWSNVAWSIRTTTIPFIGTDILRWFEAYETELVPTKACHMLALVNVVHQGSTFRTSSNGRHVRNLANGFGWTCLQMVYSCIKTATASISAIFSAASFPRFQTFPAEFNFLSAQCRAH